jgi:hypothetical protein
LEKAKKEQEDKDNAQKKAEEERKKNPHYHAYKHPKDFKQELHGTHGFKKLKGKISKDDAKSAATALEEDLEVKERDPTLMGPPSYVTLTRGPSSFHRSVRDEDSFGVHDLSPKQQET